MNKISYLLCLILACVLLPSVGLAQQQIRWEPNLESAQRLAAASNRLVMIYFWAPWCTVCKQMEADVFSRPEVAAQLSTNYVLVKINADNFPTTARQYGVTALPTTAVTKPDGQLLVALPRRMDAGGYVAWLNRVAADARPRAEIAQSQPPAAAPSYQPQPPAEQPALGNPQPQAQPQPPVNYPPPSYAQSQPPPPPPAYEQPALGNPQPQPPPAAVAPAPSYGARQPIPPSDYSLPNYSQPQPPASYEQPAPVNPQPPMQPPSYQPQPPMQPPPAAPSYQPQPPVTTVAPGNPPLAMDGCCCVSLWEKQSWVPGNAAWGAIHRGRTYLFAGPEEQRKFLADPDHYAPVVSGNDVVLAAEQGRAVPGRRQHGVFYGNRIYLFASEESLGKFSINPGAYANQVQDALRDAAYPAGSVR